MSKPRHRAAITAKLALSFACAFVIAAIPGFNVFPDLQPGTYYTGKAEAFGLPFGLGGDGGDEGEVVEATGASFAQPKSIVEVKLAPDAKGVPDICVDYVDEGYVTAQAASPARLKFQIKLDEQTYNYDLPSDGEQVVYPLNMGNGTYTFRIMQNTSGSNYVELFSTEANVSLKNEFAPFLLPNLYCNYTAKSDCIEKARELTSGVSTQAEAVEAVCTFVADHVSYDNDKAEELAQRSGYVPDPDETLATGKGICFDYASLSAAMLRSMGIPTKVMTGYVGKNDVYHAWIMVYVDGTWKTGVFDVKPKAWSRCDVTFASTGATQYVGDASAYTDRFTY